MKLIETGKTYTFDEEGYLIADNSDLLIETKWLDAISYFISIYNKDYIHSIYVRGSVCLGEAVENISDLDIIIVYREKRFLDDLNSDELVEPFDEYNKEVNSIMTDKYPFIKYLDFTFVTPELNGFDILMIKHLSTCVYGNSLIPHLRRSKKSEIAKMRLNYKQFRTHFDYMLADFISPRNIAANLLRISFILLHKTVKTDIWTRDIYQCYKHCLEVYPEQNEGLKSILHVIIESKTYRNTKTLFINYEAWLHSELLKHKIIDE